MSSTQSVPITLPPELRESLTQATSSVCETSLFAFAEGAPPAFAETIPECERWFHAAVAFSGRTRGTVTVFVPQSLATELFHAFLGCDEDDACNSAELRDMIGELANMVCGTWLTELGGLECVDLAHPEVTTGDRPVADERGIVMAVNDRPLLVRVDIEEGEP